jgi:hypothetical protein
MKKSLATWLKPSLRKTKGTNNQSLLMANGIGLIVSDFPQLVSHD